MFEKIDRTKNNVIGTMIHAVACPLIQSDGREACDCMPMDRSKAMTGADLQRILAAGPPEERGYIDFKTGLFHETAIAPSDRGGTG